MERQYKVVSNRTLMNKAGAEAGRLQVLVKTDSDVADVKYTCPECSHKEQLQQKWEKPLIVVCASCGAKMKLEKLLAAFKKEKKKEKEARRKALASQSED